MVLFKNTRKRKRIQCENIAKALITLVSLPEDIDILDYKEIEYDQSVSTTFKLNHWYDDQLLEWFEHINKIMMKYDTVDIIPREIDVKRLLHGMSINEVCKLFVYEYINGGVENAGEKAK